MTPIDEHRERSSIRSEKLDLLLSDFCEFSQVNKIPYHDGEWLLESSPLHLIDAQVVGLRSDRTANAIAGISGEEEDHRVGEMLGLYGISEKMQEERFLKKEQESWTI